MRQALNAAWAFNQPVLVKFETQWCGPCRMLTQFLQGQMLRFPALKILRVDCEASDANREYAAAQGVASYPTLMMYANGSRCRIGARRCLVPGSCWLKASRMRSGITASTIPSKAGTRTKAWGCSSRGEWKIAG